MAAALNAQIAGHHDVARGLYLRALEIDPNEPDCLHMLSVCHFHGGDIRTALTLILQALSLTDWKLDSYRHNLTLFLAKLAQSGPVTSSGRILREKYLAWSNITQTNSGSLEPLVSIVIPSYNHAAYVAATLDSVFQQTYRNIEVIVIDDGSTDGSAQLLSSKMRECPFVNQLILRENRGSVVTVNEGFSRSTGEFLNVLHSDDAFAPNRIEKLVANVSAAGRKWGFTGVEFMDALGQPIRPGEHQQTDWLRSEISAVSESPSVGLAFLTTNVSITTGNIFVARDFLLNEVPLRVFKYNDDWDFCIRASRVSEPVFLEEKLFHYRFHGKNTITSAGDGPRVEAVGIFDEYAAQDSEEMEWKNPFAPGRRVWGAEYLLRLWSKGSSLGADSAALREIAEAVSRDFATAERL